MGGTEAAIVLNELIRFVPALSLPGLSKSPSGQTKTVNLRAEFSRLIVVDTGGVSQTGKGLQRRALVAPVQVFQSHSMPQDRTAETGGC
jgi:hypothetical protein